MRWEQLLPERAKAHQGELGAQPDPTEPQGLPGWQQGQGTRPRRAHLSRSSRTGTRWPAGGCSPGSPAGLGRKRSPPACSAVETAQGGGAATHCGETPLVPGLLLLPPSHLLQVNGHLVGLHLHLLHQALPLQLQGHGSGRATAQEGPQPLPGCPAPRAGVPLCPTAPEGQGPVGWGISPLTTLGGSSPPPRISCPGCSPMAAWPR